MSQRYKVILVALVVFVVITGLILDGHSMLRSGTAAENPTASAQSQLKQKLLEKKQLLEQVVNEYKQGIDQGRYFSHSLEYMRAQEAVLRVDIELCDTKDKRAKIYNEIIRLYTERERQIERENEVRMKLGQGSRSAMREGMRKLKLDRLEVEIEMLKDQLK
jgi:hypothetical protein